MPSRLVLFLAGSPCLLNIFKYWRNPGPMVSCGCQLCPVLDLTQPQVLEPGARGRFLGLLVAIVPAAFSMGGIELVAMCAISGSLVLCPLTKCVVPLRRLKNHVATLWWPCTLLPFVSFCFTFVLQSVGSMCCDAHFSFCILDFVSRYCWHARCVE